MQNAILNILKWGSFFLLLALAGFGVRSAQDKNVFDGLQKMIVSQLTGDEIPDDSKAKKQSATPTTAPSMSKPTASELPVWKRTQYVKGADELAAEIAKRLDGQSGSEQVSDADMNETDELLKLVYDDIKNSQKEIETRRLEIETELKEQLKQKERALRAAREKLEEARQQNQKSGEKQGSSAADSAAARKAHLRNLRMLGEIFNSVDAEATVEIFEKLNQDRDGIEMIVAVLSKMRTQKVGKVLEAANAKKPELGALLTHEMSKLGFPVAN